MVPWTSEASLTPIRTMLFGSRSNGPSRVNGLPPGGALTPSSCARIAFSMHAVPAGCRPSPVTVTVVPVLSTEIAALPLVAAFGFCTLPSTRHSSIAGRAPRNAAGSVYSLAFFPRSSLAGKQFPISKGTRFCTRWRSAGLAAEPPAVCPPAQASPNPTSPATTAINKENWRLIGAPPPWTSRRVCGGWGYQRLTSRCTPECAYAVDDGAECAHDGSARSVDRGRRDVDCRGLPRLRGRRRSAGTCSVPAPRGRGPCLVGIERAGRPERGG